MKIGLIGCGGISHAHIRGILGTNGRVKITACCDISLPAAEKRAAELGVTSVHTDYHTFLREADIDAVVICTTHDTHAPIAIAAAAAGKHALVEKPIACTLADARAMVAAHDKAGTTLMVAQCQRYDPSYRGLKTVLASGELGAVRAVRFDAMQNYPAFAPKEHWLFDGNIAGGGIVISVLVHRIDLVRFLVGEVRRVTAISRSLHPNFRNGAEDFAAGILEFESGAIGEFFGTYSGPRMPYCEQLMFFCEHGAVHALPEQGQYSGPAYIARSAGWTAKDWLDQYRGFEKATPDRGSLPSDDPFVNQISHFADCVAAKTAPISSGRDNLGTMAVVEAIHRSAKLGRAVELQEL
jgi:predicted dehydrogenase